MPDLGFKIEAVETTKFSASPGITFKLRVKNSDPAETIHSVVLRSQIQLEVTRRRYTAEEQRKLLDLFGEPDRWSHTLRNLLWTHVNVNVPLFQDETVVDLIVPCTFDFNVGATKYFYGLDDGLVPVCFLFSGMVFYGRSNEPMQVAPISWDKEARFSMPIQVWRNMMDEYYPNSAWLRVRRDVFERLYEYKCRHGIPTWEEALESMLQAEETVRS